MTNTKTQYQKDLQVNLNLNGKDFPKGQWNLVHSIREVTLFSKGIKPHRMWRLQDVKNYYGLKGNTLSILKQLKMLRSEELNTTLVA